MNITFENPDKINGRLTLVVEESDYSGEVEKSLKTVRHRMNIPGFRPGMAPMSMIRRQYGAATKMEVINRLMGDELSKYITDNKIGMLGEPLPADGQEAADLEAPGPYTFVFDIAVAPEIEISLTGSDVVEHQVIVVTDEDVDSQIMTYRRRQGKHSTVDDYAKGDILRGTLTELDESGGVKAGGITVDTVSLMPEYIGVEEQRALFDNAHKGDAIVFNPRKAYPENDGEIASLLKKKREEVAELSSDFEYRIEEISRFTPADVDQELIDMVFGKDAVTGEEAFRAKIRERLEKEARDISDMRFVNELRDYCEAKVGEVTFPEALLKRVMMAKNKDKDEKYVDEHFEASLKELKWQIIRDRLAEAHGVRIDADDVKSTACETVRMQFAMYGMSDVPEEYISHYADEMIKKGENMDALVDRAINAKLASLLKDVVTVSEKKVTKEDLEVES